ncbi:MAG: alpha-ketoacid dehydrogenase subunit beta [Deltaproteobacteria bacterium]|nr:alpha-ketoacid dehydrogenase subunit beta [Deltaproteobacteria bacterium]
MSEMTYAQALNQALREEMRRDETVFLLGEDIAGYGGAFKVTQGLLDEFGPERVRNTPIAEYGIVGLAVGAALTGCRPVAEIMYMDFMALAIDQLANQAAKMRYMFGGKARVPMVVRAQEGAGRSNAAQHSQSLEAWFVHIPGIYVAIPSTPRDAKGLLKTAIRDDNPVMFIEHKLLYATRGEVPAGDDIIPLGQADVKRPGRDVTVVAVSRMVHVALQAAEQLQADGVEAEVIDPRTLVPLDVRTIADSVRRTHRLVIVHEAAERGGVSGEIAMAVMPEVFDYLDAPITRVTAPNSPVPFNARLEGRFIPTPERVAAAVRSLL